MTSLDDFYILQNLDLGLYDSRKLARQESTGKLCQLFFLNRPTSNIVLLKRIHETLLQSPQEDFIPYVFVEKKGDTLIVGIENIPGEPLERFLYREHHLDKILALEFIFHLSKGLSSAQKLGILHGNLTPAQIWTDGLQCQVMGFGLPLGEDPPFYQAPEFSKETHLPLQVHQDLYALGAIWYQLLVGMPPYQGENAKELYKSKKKILTPTPEIPEDTFPLVQKMLAPSPEQRFQSYNDFFVRMLQLRNKILAPPPTSAETENVGEKPPEAEPEDPFFLPSEARIDRFMSRLEQSKANMNKKTRRTIRFRRIFLPSMIFLGAVSLLLLTTVAFPALLNRKQTDLFESIELTEQIGTSPEEQEAIRREKLAKEALQRAEEQFQNQENLAEGILLFSEIARNFRETRSGQEAETRVQTLKKQFQEKAEEEYLHAIKKSQELQSQERFQASIEILELYLSTFPVSLQKETILQTIEQIRASAEAQFQKERQKAQQFITQKKYSEAKQIYHRLIDTYGLKAITNQAVAEIEKIETLEATQLAFSTGNKNEQERRNFLKLQITTKDLRKYLTQHGFDTVKTVLQKCETAYTGSECREYLESYFLILELQQNLITFVLELNQEYAKSRKNRGYDLEYLMPNAQRKGYLLPESNAQHLLIALGNSPSAKIPWFQLTFEEKIDFLRNILDKHQGPKKLEKKVPPSPEWFEYRMLGIGVIYLIHEKYSEARKLFQNALQSTDPTIKKKAQKLIQFQFPREK